MSETRYSVRYRPGTAMANRFGSEPSRATFDTREDAEAIRRGCPNAEHMETVAVTSPTTTHRPETTTDAREAKQHG